jgi:hypothetical protein
MSDIKNVSAKFLWSRGVELCTGYKLFPHILHMRYKEKSSLHILSFLDIETSRPHQHRSVQTSQREQYHQTTQTEETVWTSYTLEHLVIQLMYFNFNYWSGTLG